MLLALLPLPVAMMLHGIAQLASNGARAWMLRSEIDRRIFLAIAGTRARAACSSE